MEALWLKSQGLACPKRSRGLAGVSGKTLRSYFQEVVEGRIRRLKELHFRQPQRASGWRTKKRLKRISAITELTGLTGSPTQVRLFLKEKCGLRRLKIGILPAKADPEVQAAFK
ncbi:MAG: hypothetical protein ACRERU_09475, partial [Methylococcales bacterium]